MKPETLEVDRPEKGYTVHLNGICLASGRSEVAQISNLLYRRASSLQALRLLARVRAIRRPADWKSAIQQIGNLRYVKQVL
jgi:hypothetical protein